MKIFTQILGVVAAAVAITAFQAKKKQTILMLKGLDSVLFALQWGLLHEWTAMALTIVSIFRNFIMSYFSSKEYKTTYLIIGFCIINTVLGILTYDSWPGILKVAATVITTVSFGLRQVKLVRLITIPACIMGIIHASIPYHLSIGGIITESFTVISIIISLIRFRQIKSENLADSAYN